MVMWEQSGIKFKLKKDALGLKKGDIFVGIVFTGELEYFVPEAHDRNFRVGSDRLLVSISNLCYPKLSVEMMSNTEWWENVSDSVFECCPKCKCITI